MTNEELLSVAEIVERATNRFNAQAAYHRERFDEHVKLIASMKADHEAKMVEHRAAFGARTEADAKIIAGLRAEIDSLKREERATHDTLKPLVERVTSERDALRAEVAALKSQNPKQHPVKAGEWVKASNGAVAQVLEVHKDWYLISRGHGWTFANCEPCDPPEAMHAEPDLTHLHIKGKEAWSDVPNATQWVEEMRGNSEAAHDTDAGKAVAESAVGAEPVTEEIKVGDVVEVVSNTGRNTWLTDVGSVGTVTSIETLEDSLSVRLKAVPDKKNVCGGYVSICDVRKVTT